MLDRTALARGAGEIKQAAILCRAAGGGEGGGRAFACEIPHYQGSLGETRRSRNAHRAAGEGWGRRHSKPLLPSLPALICKVGGGERFPSPRPCSPPVPPSADAARGKPQPYKMSVGRHCWNPEGSGEAAVGAGCLGAVIASLIANTLTEKRALGHPGWRAPAPVSGAPPNLSSNRSVDVNSLPE